MPSLAQALGASTTQVLWIIDIYPLLMAGLLMPMGTQADCIGNRRLLLSGLIIFGVASLLAAYAPTPVMLTGARGLLAPGGAMIMPCVLGTIRRTFEEDDDHAMALASGTRIRKSPSQSTIEMGSINKWRRRWDLNPRMVAHRRFSRPVHSAALPPLRSSATHITHDDPPCKSPLCSFADLLG